MKRISGRLISAFASLGQMNYLKSVGSEKLMVVSATLFPASKEDF